MALPYSVPDPATGQWDPFALKRNLDYLDQRAVPPGVGTSPVGVVYSYTWDGAITGNNTTETVASTFVLRSNTFDRVNDMMEILVLFRTAATATNKRFRIYLGSTAIADTGMSLMNSQMGYLIARVSKETTTMQNVFSEAVWSDPAILDTPTRTGFVGETTEILTNPLNVIITMQNGTANVSDCRVDGVLAIMHRAQTQ